MPKINELNPKCRIYDLNKKILVDFENYIKEQKWDDFIDSDKQLKIVDIIQFFIRHHDYEIIPKWQPMKDESVPF